MSNKKNQHGKAGTASAVSGSVLVVGGGIAGVQAALDLARAYPKITFKRGLRGAFPARRRF